MRVAEQVVATVDVEEARHRVSEVRQAMLPAHKGRDALGGALGLGLKNAVHVGA